VNCVGENNLVPSIQPDDLVFDVEDKFAVYPQLIVEARRDNTSPSARLKEIRNLFGHKSKSRTPRGVHFTHFPTSLKEPSQIAGKVDKVFSKLGLQELELEQGLSSLDLRKEPINILLNAQYNRERRQHFLDEEDVKKGRLSSQVAKFIKKMKKGVQETKYKSRRVRPLRRTKRISLPNSDRLFQSEEKAQYDIEIQMEEIDGINGLNEGMYSRELDEEMQDISEVEEDQDCPDSENDKTNALELSQCRWRRTPRPLGGTARDSFQFTRVVHSAPCTPPGNPSRHSPMEYE